MTYIETMELLSQYALGAVLIRESGQEILAVNEAGDRLLHGQGGLIGRSLMDVAPALCDQSGARLFENIAFGEYLLQCPGPQPGDLPPGSRLVVFREGESEACHDMLIGVVNQLSESITLCDREGRVYLLNDAAVTLESMVTRDVLGKHVSEIYTTRDDSQLVIPQVIDEKRPLVNHRQYYTTVYGKDVDSVTHNYPIVSNGQVLGGFSIMEDWSQIDNLNKKILELQEKLVRRDVNGAGNEKSALSAKYRFKDIIYISASMNKMVNRCKQVAKSDSSVIIYGETGTGKELVAQSIHNASRRAKRPFLAINCAAIPENLLEGLLFGTEKGAYTGAESRPGLFEQADSGTLLLDEINSMNISLQSKLLRVLQDGMVRRVGGASESHVDVRVLSNINIPPYQAIEEGKLRQDLFYRLGVVNINIPPLREHKEDIPLLAKTFIIQCNEKLVKNVLDVDSATLALFQAYDWPGNVRELRHAIEHAMNILPDDQSMISPDCVPDHILTEIGDKEAESPPNPGEGETLSDSIQDMEYRALCKVLRENKGNVSKSAAALGMSRQNLQYRIKRYKIDVKALLDERD